MSLWVMSTPETQSFAYTTSLGGSKIQDGLDQAHSIKYTHQKVTWCWPITCNVAHLHCPLSFQSLLLKGRYVCRNRRRTIRRERGGGWRGGEGVSYTCLVHSLADIFRPTPVTVCLAHSSAVCQRHAFLTVLACLLALASSVAGDSRLYHQCWRARVQGWYGAASFHLQYVTLTFRLAVRGFLWVLWFAPPLFG